MTALANAFCESFRKTLKQEEIYCRQYEDVEDLSAHLEEFIGACYNRLRLHSALGYQTPEEFEQDSAAAAASAKPEGATMRYFQPPRARQSNHAAPAPGQSG